MERSHSELEAVIVSDQIASGFQDSPVLARIWAGPARALYVCPGLDLAPHLNVVTTVAVSLRQPFELRTWAKPGAGRHGIRSSSASSRRKHCIT